MMRPNSPGADSSLGAGFFLVAFHIGWATRSTGRGRVVTTSPASTHRSSSRLDVRIGVFSSCKNSRSLRQRPRQSTNEHCRRDHAAHPVDASIKDLKGNGYLGNDAEFRSETEDTEALSPIIAIERAPCFGMSERAPPPLMSGAGGRVRLFQGG